MKSANAFGTENLRLRALWEEHILGLPIQSPGHPIVLACMIMDRDSNLAAALRGVKLRAAALGTAKNVATSSASVDASGFQSTGTHFLPGTQKGVAVALEALTAAVKGNFVDAFALADAYWDDFLHENPYEVQAHLRGHLQRDILASLFQDHARIWGRREARLTPKLFGILEILSHVRSGHLEGLDAKALETARADTRALEALVRRRMIVLRGQPMITKLGLATLLQPQLRGFLKA